MVAPTPDSATEVGSIGSRNKTTVDHTPAPESVLDEKHDVDEKPDVHELGDKALAENAADDAVKKDTLVDDEDGVEYPVAWKLGLITIALCLSVFCVALVSFFFFTLPIF